MNRTLAGALAAHGGLDRWNSFQKLTSTIVTSGSLWAMKGLVQDQNERQMTVKLHEQWASVKPFGEPNWQTSFDPARIAIETIEGVIVKERHNPRDAFAGHRMDTPWDPLHRAYFNGYALWTYLTSPFLLAMPGFEMTDIEPWREGSETWLGVRARFPDYIASHSKEQDFYFGEDFLLRRHDYNVDVAGGFPGGQYVYDIKEFDGFKFPTKRLAYIRGENRHVLNGRIMVSIDLSNFCLS